MGVLSLSAEKKNTWEIAENLWENLWNNGEWEIHQMYKIHEWYIFGKYI